MSHRGGGHRPRVPRGPAPDASEPSGGRGAGLGRTKEARGPRRLPPRPAPPRPALAPPRRRRPGSRPGRAALSPRRRSPRALAVAGSPPTRPPAARPRAPRPLSRPPGPAVGCAAAAPGPGSEAPGAEDAARPGPRSRRRRAEGLRRPRPVRPGRAPDRSVLPRGGIAPCQERASPWASRRPLGRAAALGLRGGPEPPPLPAPPASAAAPGLPCPAGTCIDGKGQAVL